MSKISDLSDGGVIQGGDTLIAVRSGGNVKVTYGGSTTANIDGGTIDGTVIGGTTPAAGSFTTGSFTGNVSFGDNDKAVFGASSDLQIYHTGSHSFIQDTGVGDLYLTTNGDKIILRNTTLGESFFEGTSNGDAKIFYNGLEKLATTSTGIDVTGTVVSDGLTVETAQGDISISSTYSSLDFARSGTNYFRATDASGNFSFITGALDFTTKRFDILANGDLRAYENTGTTPKFVWDASAERLGIGTTSPNNIIHIQGSGTRGLTVESTNGYAQLKAVSGSHSREWTVDTAGNFYVWQANNSLRPLNIDSAGNVGIGTSSPLGQLHVEESGAAARFIVKRADGTNPADSATIDLLEGSVGGGFGTANNYGFRIALDGADNKLNIISGVQTATSTRVTLDRDSGNVGIGTDSPATALEVNGDIGIGRTAGGYTFRETVGGGERASMKSNASNELLFSIGGASEAMRIDSNRKLLVGTTHASLFDTSTQANAGALIDGVNDNVQIARWQGVPLYLNRMSTDGAIVDFRKSGASVGSIGTVDSDLLIHSTASGHGGLRFGNGYIAPTDNSGQVDDNAFQLGLSTHRFTDLYLSGGAYIGGVASANKLDDYEEGTFTPVYEPQIGSFTTMTMDVIEATYVKVGKAVTINLWVRTDDVDVTGASGSLKITGLPFNASSYGSFAIGNSASFAGDDPVFAFVNYNLLTLQYKSAINADPSNVSVTDLATGATANQNQLMLSGTYFTT